VLFLTCHLPYPPFSGGRRREHELLMRLCEDFDVEVCAVTKTLADDRAALPAVPWRHRGVELFEAIPDSHPAPQVARHDSAAARDWLRSNLHRFDGVHVEGFYLWRHLPPQRPPALLVEQNVEYELWQQRGLLSEARATRYAEQAAWTEADMLAAVTAEDCTVMRSRAGRPVSLITDGADHHSGIAPEQVTPVEIGERPAIVFVGNFGYEPNVDAARWLARDILPAVAACVDAALVLVGTRPPPAVCELAGERVEVTGRVPSIEPWLDAATVVACPLRVGGGVKVKVLEALMRGCAIVATPQCGHGIAGASDALRFASGRDEFAAALVDVLADPAERRRLRAAARACARGLPTWNDVAKDLAGCWLGLTDAREAAA
jgi:glycosyltransferase involved in cell wall biosynthesis